MNLRAAVLLTLLALAGSAAAQDGGLTVCGMGLPGDHPTGVDRDLDSVPDSDDWCPDTRPGLRVGANGCAAYEVPVRCEPAVAAVPPPPPAPAANGEPSRMKQALAVAALTSPAPLDPKADSDGDGVPDRADLCPGTPKGTAVDASGCVQIEKVVLKGVNFAMGSAQLLPGASDTLKGVALAMKASPKVQVQIDGYTDSVGNDKKNLRLSERRAESVKAFLVKEGVAPERLSTAGHGEADPADDNATAAGRANNRRVKFSVK